MHIISINLIIEPHYHHYTMLWNINIGALCSFVVI